ncbi:AMP-binding protein [Helicobacter pullorum]|uniref:AMP-binding protein n=1 Tax=Helicobacter pullorum TaxID=35818 RepID=UPI001748717A|nr:AMP-binding protein [Helicobacter pullorum]
MEQYFSANTLFFYKEQVRDFSQFLQDVFCFSQNITEESLEIFLEDTYHFLVAFFGSLLAKKMVYVLPSPICKPQYFLVNEENYHTFLKKQNSIEVVKKHLDIKSRFVIQTSGSSGERKNICKTLGQMIAEAQFLQKYFSCNSDSLFISSVSHQHLFGMTFKVFVALISGGKIYCKNLNYPEILFDFLKDSQSKNIIFLSSPVLLSSLSKQENLQVLNKITKIFTAGSKLDTQVHKILKEKTDIEIVEIYGSTETGVIAKNLGSRFEIFPHVMAMTDINKRLIVESPWTDGRELCNDCVEIDGKYLSIVGRFDRIIKFHDRRIGLDSIEKILKKHVLIADAVVCKEERYKHLSAVIVLSKEGKEFFRKQGRKGVIKILSDVLKEEYGSKLRYFYIRSYLPYNAQGKLPKKDLLEIIEARIEPIFDLQIHQADYLKLRAYIDEGCFYFNGHFSNFPLVPGFVELGYIFLALENYFGIRYERVQQIEHVKFIYFLQPCDILEMEIKIQENNKVVFKLFASGKECANGRLRILEGI